MSKTLHAVAYVDRFAGKKGKEWEPVIWGKLQVPENKDEDVHLDAILGEVKGYQCDGRERCNEKHNVARERLRIRVNPKGIPLVWRRYHPLIQEGIAKVGKAFEARDPVMGMAIRVEVREIDYANGGLRTDGAISEDAIAVFEAELKAKQGECAPKKVAQDQLRAFLHEALDPIRADLGKALKDFEHTAERKEIERLVGEVEHVADFLRDASHRIFSEDAVEGEAHDSELLQAWCDTKRAGGPTIQEAITIATERVKVLHGELDAAGARQKEIIELQTEIRELRDLVAEHDQKRREVIALRPNASLNPPEVGAIKKALEALLAEGALEGASGRIAELREQLGEHRTNADQCFAEIAEAMRQIEAIREGLALRIEEMKTFTNGAKLAEWRRVVEQGQGYPGFSVAFFTERAGEVVAKIAEQLGDLEAALDLGKASTKKEIERLEGAVTREREAFFEELMKAMAPRAKGVFHEVEAAGMKFQAPFASVRIEQGGKVLVEARNQHHHAMIVEMVDGAGKVTSLTLREKGEVVGKVAQGAKAPFQFRVVAVAADAPAEGQAQVAGQKVLVESTLIEVYRAGSHQFAAPLGYAVRPCEVEQIALNLADDPQARYRKERIPGAKGAGR
jgi:hypothetical protein